MNKVQYLALLKKDVKLCANTLIRDSNIEDYHGYAQSALFQYNSQMNLIKQGRATQEQCQVYINRAVHTLRELINDEAPSPDKVFNMALKKLNFISEKLILETDASTQFKYQQEINTICGKLGLNPNEYYSQTVQQPNTQAEPTKQESMVKWQNGEWIERQTEEIEMAEMVLASAGIEDEYTENATKVIADIMEANIILGSSDAIKKNIFKQQGQSKLEQRWKEVAQTLNIVIAQADEVFKKNVYAIIKGNKGAYTVNHAKQINHLLQNIGFPKDEQIEHYKGISSSELGMSFMNVRKKLRNFTPKPKFDVNVVINNTVISNKTSIF